MALNQQFIGSSPFTLFPCIYGTFVARICLLYVQGCVIVKPVLVKLSVDQCHSSLVCLHVNLIC